MGSLKESRDWTRRTFQGILKEYGAFDPKPAAPSPGPDDSPPAEGGGRGA